MKIVVLAGGLSPERDVSFSSGALISNALMEKGHDVMLVDLFLGTRHPGLRPIYRNQRDHTPYAHTVPPQEPDLAALRASVPDQKSLIGEGVLELCRAADRVFLALHGSVGENGQLQAVLDMNGISYTGTGYAGSLLAMDKDLSKQLMRQNGILTADWQYLHVQQAADYNAFVYPCVVKPCSCGSSVGVALVENRQQMRAALAAAGKYEQYVLIEQMIAGREFSVGILNGKALPVIEIRPLSGFYDYKNKYQKGMTQEICPAQLPHSLCSLLQNSALRVHQVLRLGYYSRIDFIVDAKGRAYCLEANTLPGMTPTSLLPQEAAAAGIAYPDLCDRIVRERLA